MSETFKIGDYTIETKRFYDSLKEVGITSKDKLKKLDTNGDKILTEDEFVDLDIEDEEFTTKKSNKSSSSTGSTAKTLEEQVEEAEEKYDKQILSLYEQLESLEEKRMKYYSSIGKSKDIESMSSAISGADGITSQLQSVRAQIVTLTSNYENQIAQLKALAQMQAEAEAAAAANQAMSTLNQTDGEYTINTSANNSAKSTSLSNVKFDFSENLTSGQQSDLQSFKSHYEQNKSRYQNVANQTGIPAELIAAIHWREATGSFNARLHDGGSLGNFSSWEESAIDALKGYSVNKNDIKSWYDMAERYNGLGYRNKGVSSPYVWAGTTNYSSGKYVADGVYDGGYVDKQLGVAVMLKALLS